ARAPLPAWDNSAMDGYAVRAEDLPATLPVAGVIAAGNRPGATLAPATTWRIMTGAPIPEGADTVVMRENVIEGDDQAVFESPATLGRHIRRAGEDIEVGDVAIRSGTLLRAGELGVLAALAHQQVVVGKQPRVALLSTGTELVAVGEKPEPGQKINSNAVALGAEIAAAGGVVVSDAIAHDDKDSMRQAFRAALAESDVLITSGGVSAGDFDFARDVAADVGITIDFWKVAIKPGKPMVFGTTDSGQLYFGLPGNPVSTMVTFELFVRPALLAMAGARDIDRPRAPVELATSYEKKKGRAHYLRSSVRREGQRLIANVGRKQGSGMLTSMLSVDALIEIPIDSERQSAGSTVTALLLEPR
ncbi:MAG: molybdopterin molybdotransferase MoeA, partial [Deltaproteobacteria bacterium]|nr:molybdopterin molybdotransferase MoeA [Deltaproteobacteria bacterium]